MRDFIIVFKVSLRSSNIRYIHNTLNLDMVWAVRL